MVLVVAALLGVGADRQPAAARSPSPSSVVLGAGFFSPPVDDARRVVLSRDRLMGIGQAITMPLFFASNALYPIALMPAWVRAISRVNPLSYEVDALRGLLLDRPAAIGTDLAVLVLAAGLGITVAALLLPRLAR